MFAMLQAGVWEVDGTGMWAIEDPEVDLGIRKVGLPSLLRFTSLSKSALLLRSV